MLQKVSFGPKATPLVTLSLLTDSVPDTINSGPPMEKRCDLDLWCRQPHADYQLIAYVVEQNLANQYMYRVYCSVLYIDMFAFHSVIPYIYICFQLMESW